MQRDWLAHSPLGFVATTDAQGRVDVSPKGDPPGFVHVIDDTTIAIPERPGNKRVDGYLNVLQRPHVGTLFLIPGPRRHLADQRHRARSSPTPTISMRWRSRASGRSWRWRSTSKRCSSTAPRHFCGPTPGIRRRWNPTAVPSVAQLAKALSKTDMSQAELDEYYSEDELPHDALLTRCSWRTPTAQIWLMPPSTGMSAPVVKLLRSDARNNTALATSSGVP